MPGATTFRHLLTLPLARSAAWLARNSRCQVPSTRDDCWQATRQHLNKCQNKKCCWWLYSFIETNERCWWVFRDKEEGSHINHRVDDTTERVYCRRVFTACIHLHVCVCNFFNFYIKKIRVRSTIYIITSILLIGDILISIYGSYYYIYNTSYK